MKKMAFLEKCGIRKYEALDRIPSSSCAKPAIRLLESQDEKIFGRLDCGHPSARSAGRGHSRPGRIRLAVYHVSFVDRVLFCRSVGGGKITMFAD